MMRQLLLRALFCAIGVFIHFGGPFAAETIRVVYSSVNPHALLVSMAEKRGLYAKYGLASTIVYVSGGSIAIQAMVSGDVDLAQLTAAPGVAANLRGADIVYVAMTDDRMGYQLETRREIKSANELKGKRFAISRFASSADFGARALLRRLGVDPKDVTILQIGNEADRLAALRSGSVDGSVFNAPFGAVAKKFDSISSPTLAPSAFPTSIPGFAAARSCCRKTKARF